MAASTVELDSDHHLVNFVMTVKITIVQIHERLMQRAVLADGHLGEEGFDPQAERPVAGGSATGIHLPGATEIFADKNNEEHRK